jgi:hypothetical protein
MLKETCVVAARCPTGDNFVLTENEVIRKILSGPVVNQCIYKPSQFLKLSSFFYLKNCHAKSESDGQLGAPLSRLASSTAVALVFFLWLDG